MINGENYGIKNKHRISEDNIYEKKNYMQTAYLSGLYIAVTCIVMGYN